MFQRNVYGFTYVYLFYFEYLHHQQIQSLYIDFGFDHQKMLIYS